MYLLFDRRSNNEIILFFRPLVKYAFLRYTMLWKVKKMDKANIILDAMKTLLEQDDGASCSVSDIAKKAGIGKGSILSLIHI